MFALLGFGLGYFWEGWLLAILWAFFGGLLSLPFYLYLFLRASTGASTVKLAEDANPRQTSSAPVDSVCRLEELENLRAKGLITIEEYERKKAAILSSL